MRSHRKEQHLLSSLLRIAGAAVFSAALAAAPVFAGEREVNRKIDDLLGDHQVFRDTLEDIRQRIAEEDTVGFSAYIAYPITVKVKGKRRTIRSAEQFEPLYSDIITPDISEMLLFQDWGTLFVNSEGVMFGSGEVWMNAICLDDGCAEFEVKITTIQSVD